MKNFLLFVFLILIFSATIAQDIESNLVAHYKFCGDLLDESGYNNHGEFMGNGSLTFSEDHQENANSALLLNGNDQYINVASSESLNSPVEEVSITLWFNYTAGYNGWIVPLTKTNSLLVEDRQYGFGINDGTGLTYMNTYYVGLYPYQANTWYHGAITYTENEYRFYVNGELIQSGVPEDPIIQNDQPLEIGRDVPQTTEYYNGLISEIRIYSRALTGEEVNLIMNAEGCNANSIDENPFYSHVDVFPNPANEVLNLDFNEFSGNKEVFIYNSLGQIILQHQINTSKNQLNIMKFESGIYHVLIKDEEEVYRTSFIKL